jgi:transcriptional regulator with XRE-family HTH domain
MAICAPYSAAMPPLDVRRHQFAVFIRRGCDHAKLTRGWSVPEIARRAGIGVATIYRWLNEQWTENPDPNLIEKFCDALDLSPTEAFMILWPGKNSQTQQPVVMPKDQDFDVLLRKLNDPKVSEREKFLIRETIRSLALRGK